MKINVNVVNGVGLVIICGPTTTGKTSVARNLLKFYKGDNAEWISYGEVWGEVRKRQRKEMRVLEFSQKISRRVRKSLEARNFTVLETSVVSNAELYSLLTAIRILGYQGEITLIMIDLDEETHISYVKNRKRGAKPSLKEVKRQRKIFYEQLIPNADYDQLVNKCVITDPNDVQINFIK